MLHISLHVCTYVSIARRVNLSFEDVMELSKIVRSYRLKRIFVSKLLSIAKGGIKGLFFSVAFLMIYLWRSVTPKRKFHFLHLKGPLNNRKRPLNAKIRWVYFSFSIYMGRQLGASKNTYYTLICQLESRKCF